MYPRTAQSSKKKEPSLGDSVLGLVVLVLLVWWLFFSGGDKSSAPNGNVPMAGTIATARDDSFICATMDDFERMEKLVKARDKEGLRLMVLQGRISVLPGGTRVRVIESHVSVSRAAMGHRGSPTEIRILDTGQSGYVDSYFLGP
ncbi:MAG: hypothetical protein KY476_06935 [Planctomycetes bacterium]|nr:hypothetical protein [Planctomycetota bacterium]